MKKYSSFLTGLLLIFQLNALAQQDTLSAKAPPSIPLDERTLSTIPDKAYFKSFLTDGRDLLISPFRWSKYQWIAFSGVTLMYTWCYSQDAKIQKVVEENQNPWLDGASTYGFERLGSGLYTLPALGILYGVGAITKNDKARYTALKGVEAYMFGFVTAQVFKQLTHRRRPYEVNSLEPMIWKGPFAPPSNSSFPSGHSTVAFAVATVVAMSYMKTVWVPIVCFTLAGLTAASRVYQNDHWFSDVFVGSALGIGIGSTIMNNHLKKLKVLPISHVGMGVMFVYQLD